MINAKAPSDLNWMKHLHGMIAVVKGLVERDQLSTPGIPLLILSAESPPSFENLSESRRGNLVTGVPQPAESQFGDLCFILPKVQALFKKSAAMLEPLSIRYESTIQRYRDEAMALRSELSMWASALPDGARPETIARFTQPYVLRFPGADDILCPTTRADIHSDCK
jgi:hypothetical protein